MEKILGIDQLRPRLGKYLDEVEKGNIFIITSRSNPKGVLISYAEYEELKNQSEKARQAEIKATIDKVRERAEEAGYSEKDVQAEIDEVRSCEQ